MRGRGGGMRGEREGVETGRVLPGGGEGGGVLGRGDRGGGKGDRGCYGVVTGGVMG